MEAVEQASAENLLGGIVIVGGHVGFDILLPVFGSRGEGGQKLLVDGGGLVDGEQEGLLGEDLGGLDVVDVAAIAMAADSSSSSSGFLFRHLGIGFPSKPATVVQLRRSAPPVGIELDGLSEGRGRNRGAKAEAPVWRPCSVVSLRSSPSK